MRRMRSVITLSLLFTLLLPRAIVRAQEEKDWLKIRLAEATLTAPFAFLPKRDARPNLPPSMAEQFVSFDIYESETKASFPMHVNMIRIQYRDAANVNIDGTIFSSFQAIAEQQGHKDPPYDKNTLQIDGLDARRIHYNGLGFGKPVSVESVAARQGPVIWSVMVTYSKAVPRDSVLRLLDSVHFAPPQPTAAVSAPNAAALPGGEKEAWFITSMDEVTLEAPFQFSAKKDSRDQAPEAVRKNLESYDSWRGSAHPALPIEATLSRLRFRDSSLVSLSKIAAAQIQGLASKAGEDPSVITTTEGKLDGLSTLTAHYDGLARGKKLSSDLLVGSDGPTVWVLQTVWSGGVPASTPLRLINSVHIVTPDPDATALAATKADARGIAGELTSAFIWCSAMKATLADVIHSAPELANDGTRAGLEWDNAFKPAFEGLTLRVKEGAGSEWDTIRQQLQAKLGQAEVQAFTHDQGVEIISSVRKHSRGRMPPSVLRMLLASNPAYRLQPAREMSDGYAGAYLTVSSPKAHGVKLSVKYPLSWVATSLDADNVLIQWASDGGHGTDFLRLAVSALPANATPEMGEAMFSPEGARTMVPADGKFLRHRIGELNERPLGILHFTMNPPLGITGPAIRGVMYYFVDGNNIVSLQGLSTPIADNEEAREDRFRHLEPLYKAVLNSIRKME